MCQGEIGGFSDDYYIVQADVSSFTNAYVWVRYVDPNNGSVRK